MDLLAEGLNGGIGGFIGRAISFPLDTLKVKLATDKTGISLGAVVRQILDDEGILGFFRGVHFAASEAFLQKGLYVYFYATLKWAYKVFWGRETSSLDNLLFGYISGLATVPFSVPFEAMTVQLQTAPLSVPRSRIIHDALFTWHGLKIAFTSGRAYLVVSMKSGIEFSIFDCLKRAILRSRSSSYNEVAPALSPSTAFGLGAIARSIATVVMYPYIRGKALTQAKIAPSTSKAILYILQTEGPKGLFYGLSMELLRGVSQAAIMFAIMERIRAVVHRLVVREHRRGVEKSLEADK